MIILNENEALKIKLKEAHETTQRDFAVSYGDSTGTGLYEGGNKGRFSNTGVIMAAAPNAGVKRIIKGFNISNTDTKKGKFIIYIDDGNNETIVYQKSLAIGDSFDSLSNGGGGGGAGGMEKSVYDPNLVEGDAFNMDNMINGTNKQYATVEEKGVWNGKQDELISGGNIKSVNGQSLLGEGDLSMEEIASQEKLVYDAYVAGEPIEKGNFCYEDMATPVDTFDMHGQYILGGTGKGRIAQMIVGKGEPISKLQLYVKRRNSPSVEINARIQTDDDLKPSGTDVQNAIFTSIDSKYVGDTKQYNMVEAYIAGNDTWTVENSGSSVISGSNKHGGIRLTVQENTDISSITKENGCNATFVIVKKNNKETVCGLFHGDVADVNMSCKKGDIIDIIFTRGSGTMNNVAIPMPTSRTLGNFKIEKGFNYGAFDVSNSDTTPNTGQRTQTNAWMRVVLHSPDAYGYITQIRCRTSATHNDASDEYNNIRIYGPDRKTLLSKNVSWDSTNLTYTFDPIYVDSYDCIWINFPLVSNGWYYNNRNFDFGSFRARMDDFETLWDYDFDGLNGNNYLWYEINRITYLRPKMKNMQQDNNGRWDTYTYRRYKSMYLNGNVLRANSNTTLTGFIFRRNYNDGHRNPSGFVIYNKDRTKILSKNTRIIYGPDYVDNWNYVTGGEKFNNAGGDMDRGYFTVTFDPIELSQGEEILVLAPAYQQISKCSAAAIGSTTYGDFTWTGTIDGATSGSEQNCIPRNELYMDITGQTDNSNIYNLKSINTRKRVVLEKGRKYWLVITSGVYGSEVIDPSDYYLVAKRMTEFMVGSCKNFNSTRQTTDNWALWYDGLNDINCVVKPLIVANEISLNPDFRGNDAYDNKCAHWLQGAQRPIVATNNYNVGDMGRFDMEGVTKAFTNLIPFMEYELMDPCGELIPLGAHNTMVSGWTVGYGTIEGNLFIKPCEVGRRMINAGTDYTMAQDTTGRQTQSRKKYTILKSIRIGKQGYYRINIEANDSTTAYYKILVNGKAIAYVTHANSTNQNIFTTDTFLKSGDVVSVCAKQPTDGAWSNVNAFYIRYANGADPTVENNGARVNNLIFSNAKTIA